MPLGNASESKSEQERLVAPGDDQELTSAWTIPIGQLGRTRFYLSGSVLIASAVLVVVVATVTGQQANSDLPLLALSGVAIWLGGWTIQAAVRLAVSRWLGCPVSAITLGLIGVETRPQRTPPLDAMTIWTSMLASLIICGAILGWLGSVFAPAARWDLSEFWRSPRAAFADGGSIWLLAAWLFCVQALIHLYPLPRTAGRAILAAVTHISFAAHTINGRVTIIRRVLTAIALGTTVIALVMLADPEPQNVFVRWPFVLILAVLLAISGRSSDIRARVLAFEAAGEGTDESGHSPPQSVRRQSAGRSGPRLGRLREAFDRHRVRRRVRRAMDAERREAVDAARVDEILERLHDRGIESLSPADRKILERVSDTLRKHRRAEGDPR